MTAVLLGDLYTTAIPVQRLDVFADNAVHGNYPWAPEFFGLGRGLPSAVEVSNNCNLTTIRMTVSRGATQVLGLLFPSPIWSQLIS